MSRIMSWRVLGEASSQEIALRAQESPQETAQETSQEIALRVQDSPQETAHERP